MKKLLLIALVLCVACSAQHDSAKRFAKAKYDLQKRHPRDP